MHPVLLDCLVYWRVAAYNKFFKLFYFLGIGGDLSFLIHDFINLSLFSLILIRLVNGLSTLLILSKNQLLVLLICSKVLLVSISLSSARIFINSLLLLAVFSLASLGVRLAFGFQFFPVFGGMLVLRCISPSQDCFCCIPKILNGCIFILISFHESF